MPTIVGERLRRFAPDHRAFRGIDGWTVVRLGVVAGTVIAAVLAVRAFGRPYDFFDLRIYHGAVVWWAGGGELYDYIAPQTTLGFTYPPFAALVMWPMAQLSVTAAGYLNAVASMTALAVVLTALLVPVADRCRWPRWFAMAIAVPLAAATEPVRETIGYGQVNLLLFGLVLADLVALRWRHRAGVARATGARTMTTRIMATRTMGTRTMGTRATATRAGVARTPAAPGALVASWLHRLWTSGTWAGAGIGLATAVKLTPGLFIVYLLVSKQWRAAATAVGTALTVTVGAFLVAGEESFAYFGTIVWQTSRVGVADMTPNQSLAGVLARLYDSAEAPSLLWLTFAVLMLAVGLSRAATAHAEGDELTAFTLVGLTANVISPISWSHHLVFVLPAVVVLLDTALRRRQASMGLRMQRFPALAGLRHAAVAAGVYVLFVVSPIWPYEHRLPEVSHYADGLSGALFESSLAIAVIALVAALPWRPGAEPAFYQEHAFGRAWRRAWRRALAVRGS
ncbi:MAG TPA: glycosyltransferase 87 family protein [Micromonosporaceae bacterium]|nr:glycosyltransferase 87 family protein [Micromonosporaceae bacterium]